MVSDLRDKFNLAACEQCHDLLYQTGNASRATEGERARVLMVA
jgi:hypothetical protein